MKKIALIIGHSAKRPGAINKTYGVSEFEFNEPLAHSVAEKLILEGYQPIIVYRDASYSALPAKVNQTGAAIAVSFHCNAFNEKASGCEVLYSQGSIKGEKLAKLIQGSIVKKLGFTDRGIKPRLESDRGGLILKRTSMPCVIVEPFFIDHNASLELARYKFEDLAEAYTQGIKSFFKDGE
jgi:N-acetylmuramoyl-L-alanine amidase